MSFIYSIKTDVPEYKYDQYEVYEHLAPHLPKRQQEILKAILRSTKIRQRYFSAELGFMIDGAAKNKVAQKFQIWESASLNYLQKGIEQLLNKSGLSADQIDGICVNSNTGVITPGLDVLLADVFSFRGDIARFPFFSYACAGGLIAMHKMAEFLELYPKKCVLYCSTETNSPHLHLSNDMSSIVHNSIFADGFATLLMVGREHPLVDNAMVEIMNTKSELITQGRKSLTYTLEEEGLKGRLSASLPAIVKEHICRPVNELLDHNSLDLQDLDYLVTHIGGPKVIKNVQDTLGLPQEMIQPSFETYLNFGNQASVSVLNSLDQVLRDNEKPGMAMFMAIGPGVCIELTYAKLIPNRKNDKQTPDSTYQQVASGSKMAV